MHLDYRLQYQEQKLRIEINYYLNGAVYYIKRNMVSGKWDAVRKKNGIKIEADLKLTLSQLHCERIVAWLCWPILEK